MSESELFDKEQLCLEQQFGSILNCLSSSHADEILDNKKFWEDLYYACSILVNYVRQTKSFKSHTLVKKWIKCLKAIRDKDKKLYHKLTDSSVKTIFNDLIYGDTVLPPWFIKTFLNFILSFLSSDTCILSKIYNKVCYCKDYNVQKSYIEVINQSFNTNIILNELVNEMKNKELQTLFNSILEDDNSINIRLFLNKLNDVTSVRIFSFKSEQIKLNGLLLVKDTWVDVNISPTTITFECMKSDLPSDEKTKDEENVEYDIITIKMCSISHLRYKGNKSPECGEGHELILELTEPCRGYLESSNEFLENFRTVIFYILDNTDRVNDFILQYFSDKLEISPETLDPSNFDLYFSDEFNAASPCPTVQLSSNIDTQLTSPENLNKNAAGDHNQSQNLNESLESSELDESLYMNCSGSKNEEDILQTPKPCDRGDIAVEDSPVTDDSICSDSDVPEYDHLNYDSPILAPFPIRSPNVSVAATYSSQESQPHQQDSGIDQESTQSSTKSVSRTGLSGLPMSVPETPVISVRTPESINKFSPEIIDLISPDLPSNSFKTQNEILPDESQIKKDCDETTSQVLQELNVPPAVEPPIEDVVNVEEQPRLSQQSDTSEDDVPLEKRAQNEDDRHSQVSSTQNSQNRLNTSQASRVSTTSSRGRKRRLSQTDPPYYPGLDVLNCRNWTDRSSLVQDIAEVNDDDEFEDSSFFSDKEKETDNEFTYTRTRRVKKPVLYQSGSDSESNKRKRKSKQKKNPELMPPPVKRLKTILPLRTPENYPSCSTAETNANVNRLEPEDIPSCSKTNSDLITSRRRTVDAIPTKVGNRRRLSNLNNVDHLQEQPQSEVFRISVPTLKNKNNKKSPPGLKTTQICRQEVASASHAGENVNEVFHKSKKIIDKFDKLKLNIPFTQPTAAQKKIAFFSSSSSSSQNSPVQQVHPENDMNDHEEIFPPEQIINEVAPIPSTNINDSHPVPRTSNANEIVPQPVPEPSKATKIVPQHVPRPSKANEIVPQPVPGPSKAKDSVSLPVPSPSSPNKKPKRVVKKRKGYESEPLAFKPGRKKKNEQYSAKENQKQTVPTTPEVVHNVPQERISNQPNLEALPVFDLTSLSQGNSCKQCGSLGIAISKEMQAIIKRLCELCIMSFTNQTRDEYCAEMEEFFKDMKKQK